MSSWWGKLSSKEGKWKAKKESIFDAIQRKLKNASKDNRKSGGSKRHCSDTNSEKGSRSVAPSSSSSPSKQVSRCQSFAEIYHSPAQPLPSPGSNLHTIDDDDSEIISTAKLERARCSKPSIYVSSRGVPTNVEGDSSVSSIDSGDSDSHIVSPRASRGENGNRASINSCFRVAHKDRSHNTIKRSSRRSSKPAHQSRNNKLLSAAAKGVHLHPKNLQVARPGGLCSAPDSSMSNPSINPMKASGSEQVLNSEFLTGKPYPTDIASGNCYNLGSGHNSVGGNLSRQTFCPQHRCSPECSPIPSPGMTSPGPGSRIQSGTVTPLHPQAGGAVAESPTRRSDNVKQQTHPLPLPPIRVTDLCPYSTTYSVPTTPAVRSPSSTENSTSPCLPWKKGQLLGRGTYGHVYLGFNRESGEMCAMKEVILYSDDARSRECAQQLGQEIAMLSQLQHPNIVQYYGTETVDDKLYIYLEYVSGGSIYKLVQEYGPLGENAIRNYTRQILLGLAYLHAKNTVHRDIKGANILVDPNGRIKLVDFGMAKHISGQACPFSLKGSPYWMAPEVINNSNGCNLAVDIWSLGCTVLEMATSKPPWSQYEGVAAMFKIGNTKELPTIPEHLSEEGKDFVRLCLQRNPRKRPSAVQLLEHPFVKNAVSERNLLPTDPSEAPPGVINALRSLAIGPDKHKSRSSRAGPGSRDAHSSRNMSCPASPTGNLILPSRLTHASGRMPPSPLSSPHTASGSSTPITSGGGAIPLNHTKQPIFQHEAKGMFQQSQNSNRNTAHTASGSSTPITSGGGAIPLNHTKQPIFQHEAKGMFQQSQNSNRNTAHQKSKNGQFGKNVQTKHACRDANSSDNAILAKNNRRVSREVRDGKSDLDDCLSQQLSKDHVRVNAPLSLNPGAPRLGRKVGHDHPHVSDQMECVKYRKNVKGSHLRSGA